jgi:hypothetical protein
VEKCWISHDPSRGGNIDKLLNGVGLDFEADDVAHRKQELA